MTEAASQITANPVTGVRKPGSVGLPVGVEVRVVVGESATAERPPAPDGAIGHVEIRGPVGDRGLRRRSPRGTGSTRGLAADG